MTSGGKNGIGDVLESTGVDIVLDDNVIDSLKDEIFKSPLGHSWGGGEEGKLSSALDLEAELGEVEVDGEFAKEGEVGLFVGSEREVDRLIDTSLVFLPGRVGGEVDGDTHGREGEVSLESGEGWVDGRLEQTGAKVTVKVGTIVVNRDVNLVLWMESTRMEPL